MERNADILWIDGSARSGVAPGRSLTQIEFGAAQTTVVTGTDATPDATLALAIGTRRTAETFFRHDPPTPRELEAAIDTVEDEVMQARAIVAGGSLLIATDRTARAVAQAAGLAATGAASLSLAAVEQLFQRLASESLGNPAARHGLPPGNAFVAAVLILREFMHHLGFDSITIATGTAAARAAGPDFQTREE